MTATAGFCTGLEARRLIGAFAGVIATGLLCAPVGLAIGPVTESELRDAIAAQMSQAGPRAGAYVVDLSNGHVVFGDRSTVRRVPASLEKLHTPRTALLRLGPRARLSTPVLGVGRRVGATGGGDLYLGGAGDFHSGTQASPRHG